MKRKGRHGQVEKRTKKVATTTTAAFVYYIVLKPLIDIFFKMNGL